MILGETKSLRETISADSTFTIDSRSVSIYDAAGVEVDNGEPALSGAGTAEQTLSWPFTPSAAGHYTAVFTATVGDEIRLFEQQFTVDPLPRFSYNEPDLADGTDTAAGRLALTRLFLTDTVDTDDQPAIFSDAEIRAFLAAKSDNPYQAAAFGYRTWARSRGRIALIMSRDGFTTQRHAIDHLLKAACDLEQEPLRGTLQTGEIDASVPNYLLESFRPYWRSDPDYTVE